MRQFIIFYLFLLLNVNIAFSQSVKDTFEINEEGYKGYIVKPDPDDNAAATNYRPSRKDVILAEKYLKEFLKTYIDSNCKTSLMENNDDECNVLKKEFKKYFRQYHGMIENKTGHKYIYIVSISPELQSSYTNLKEQTEVFINDFGSEILYIFIDITTGEVIQINGNGYG